MDEIEFEVEYENSSKQEQSTVTIGGYSFYKCSTLKEITLPLPFPDVQL